MRLSDSRHSMDRVPPGRRTSHTRSQTPSSTPATTVAHAPVPHASVGPAPRSYTTMSMSARLRTLANSALVRAGKAALPSTCGPVPARSKHTDPSLLYTSSSTKAMQWGFPIDTHVTANVCPSGSVRGARTAGALSSPLSLRSVVGTSAGTRMGSPMSTVTRPSSRTSGTMTPASVCTRHFPGGALSISLTNLARHLIPFPHISGSLPSLL
mmetsp:Transcript_9010/g.20474  ORF Transcript_9010/g.20474 Transcript_9010/m.20474 type:complete len:211 (+) Transcript_9010:81-713(+)